MAKTTQDYSAAAGSNTALIAPDGTQIPLAEGQTLPKHVNDALRALMADTAIAAKFSGLPASSSTSFVVKNVDSSDALGSLPAVSGKKLELDGAVNPGIMFGGTSAASHTYTFDTSHSSMVDHLRFYTDAGQSTEWTSGVTVTGTAGQTGASTSITIADNTPKVLYYQLAGTAGLGGIAYVISVGGSGGGGGVVGGTGVDVTNGVVSIGQPVATTDDVTFANVAVTGNVDGRDVSVDGAKLDGIEAGATGDQTDAEIKTAYENNANTNAFTDSEQNKLAGIEAGATADQTDAEIKTAYEANNDTNAFTDAEKTKLAGIEASATGDLTGAEIKSLYEAEANAFTDAQFTKLAGIETGATADQTDVEIKTAYENNANTNAFTDAEKTKLSGVETGATADQTGAEIKSLYEAEANAFTDAQFTKLAGIETGATADQTDAEIKTAYEANNDTNAFTDAEKTKLAGIEASATADQTGAEIKSLYEAEANAFTDAQFTKLAGIEAGATADQSDAEIKTAYEANNDTNAFTDAEKTKLTGVETGATADQTGAEIKSLYEAETNAFTDAQFTKLAGIETGATADQSDAEIKTAYENNANTNAFTDAEKTKLSNINQGVASTDSVDFANIDVSGEIRVSTIDPDPDGNDGTLVVKGNLQVDGDTTTINSTIVEIGDKNIVLGADATALTQADGAGITAFRYNATDATVSWDETNNEWDVSNGLNVAGNIAATGTIDGRDVAADGSKLDGIEAGATADQSNAEIKTAYEANNDTNAFTDAEKTKLTGIESNATADQSAAEIKTLYESNADRNAFTDAEKLKLTGIESGATADQSAAEIKTLYESNANTNAFTDAEKTKLLGIETNAKDDQTGAEIKSLYEAQADTNAFTDAEKTKLTGIESNATADQTGAEIKTAYEGEANTNAFTDAEKTKLSNIDQGVATTDSPAFAGLTVDTDTLFVDATNNAVGVGTTSITSGSTLDVDGIITADLIALDAATTEARYIKIGGGRSGDGASYIDLISNSTYADYSARFVRWGGANQDTQIRHRGTGNLLLVTDDAGTMRFDTSNTERMRIKPDGKVGIGTTAPGAELHVNDGGATGPTVIFEGGGTNQNSPANDEQTLFLKTGSGTGDLSTGIGFWATFENFSQDTNHRRAADIRAGFDGGTWGNEYMSFHAGNGSGAGNDAAAMTTERMRINTSGTLKLSSYGSGNKTSGTVAYNLAVNSSGELMEVSPSQSGQGGSSSSSSAPKIIYDSTETNEWLHVIAGGSSEYGGNVDTTVSIPTGATRAYIWTIGGGGAGGAADLGDSGASGAGGQGGGGSVGLTKISDLNLITDITAIHVSVDSTKVARTRINNSSGTLIGQGNPGSNGLENNGTQNAALASSGYSGSTPTGKNVTHAGSGAATVTNVTTIRGQPSLFNWQGAGRWTPTLSEKVDGTSNAIEIPYPHSVTYTYLSPLQGLVNNHTLSMFITRDNATIGPYEGGGNSLFYKRQITDIGLGGLPGISEDTTSTRAGGQGGPGGVVILFQ